MCNACDVCNICNICYSSSEDLAQYDRLEEQVPVESDVKDEPPSRRADELAPELAPLQHRQQRWLRVGGGGLIGFGRDRLTCGRVVRHSHELDALDAAARWLRVRRLEGRESNAWHRAQPQRDTPRPSAILAHGVERRLA